MGMTLALGSPCQVNRRSATCFLLSVYVQRVALDPSARIHDPSERMVPSEIRDNSCAGIILALGRTAALALIPLHELSSRFLFFFFLD